VHNFSVPSITAPRGKVLGIDFKYPLSVVTSEHCTTGDAALLLMDRV
jgi:hypothetical protein